MEALAYPGRFGKCGPHPKVCFVFSHVAVGGDVGGQVQGGGDQDGAAGGGVRRAEGRAGHGPQAAPRRLRDQDEAHRRPRGTVEKGEDIRPPLAEGGGLTHLCLVSTSYLSTSIITSNTLYGLYIDTFTWMSDKFSQICTRNEQNESIVLFCNDWIERSIILLFWPLFLS